MSSSNDSMPAIPNSLFRAIIAFRNDNGCQDNPYEKLLDEIRAYARTAIEQNSTLANKVQTKWLDLTTYRPPHPYNVVVVKGPNIEASEMYWKFCGDNKMWIIGERSFAFNEVTHFAYIDD